MFKKTITYEDFSGGTVTEDFYFNLSKGEVVAMEMASSDGGYSGLLERIIKEKDNSKMVSIFQDIILKSVGRKSADGRKFVKNDQIREDFASTNAYSELFVELATQAGAAAEFVNGLFPKKLLDEAAKDVQSVKIEAPAEKPKDLSVLADFSAEDIERALAARANSQ